MPGPQNLTIVQGETFTQTFRVKDSDGEVLDLSGMTVAAQVRPTYDSDIATTFTVTLDEPNGLIILSLSAEETAAIELAKAGVWDLELTDGPVVMRLLEGRVFLDPEATRV